MQISKQSTHNLRHHVMRCVSISKVLLPTVIRLAFKEARARARVIRWNLLDLTDSNGRRARAPSIESTSSPPPPENSTNSGGDAKKVALYAPRYVRLELAAADAQDNGEEDEVEVGHRTRTSNPQLQSIAFLPFRRSALAGEEEGDRREKPIFPRRRRRLFSRQTEQRPRTDGRAGGRDTARKVLRREATGSYTRAGEGKGGRKGLKTGRKNVGRGTCCEGPWSGLQYFPLSQSHFRYIQF